MHASVTLHAIPTCSYQASLAKELEIKWKWSRVQIRTHSARASLMLPHSADELMNLLRPLICS